MTADLFPSSSGRGALSTPPYRYRLWRYWSEEPSVLFVMLNPSTADEREDDPTIRRCVALAKSWDHGGIEVVNLFALRSTDPKGLRWRDDRIGPENDAAIAGAARDVSRVVVAWGRHRWPFIGERARAVYQMLRSPVALKVNSDGSPMHPLYCPGSAVLQPFPAP